MHGFAGTASALLAGLDHLPNEIRRTLPDRIVNTLLTTITRRDGRANWPRSTQAAPWRLYHCHGARGIINSLAKLPRDTSDELEAALTDAGEVVHEAGPLRKGSNLCHGTSGNGFAFLKLYERTGEKIWLERARAFAMHARWQVEASREVFSPPRHTHWTGDIGVAVFLHECIDAKARFPMFDSF